jgi:hypothetical protein
LTTLGEKREKVAVYAWKFGVDGRRNGKRRCMEEGVVEYDARMC